MLNIGVEKKTRESSASQVALRQPLLRQHESCRLAAILAADAFQIPLLNVIAGTRGSIESARARQAAMYLAHVALGISLSAIGKFFGRDHSTIAHGCRRVEDRRDDSGFDVLIAELALAARIAMHLDREITA